jgi:hypothetical protein
MSNVFKPQREFISVLPTAIMLMRGRINSGNSGNYSELSGKTFSRQFRTPSDFTQFNGIGMSIKPHTSVLDAFYNGTRFEAERGLEISELAADDVTCNTAYSLSVWQTPAGFAGQDIL